MKHFALSILFILSLSITLSSFAQGPSISQNYFDQIDSLINKKDFFSARSIYYAHQKELTDIHRLKAGASIDNVFNRLDSSNQKIKLLFSKYGSQLKDEDRFNLLKIKQMNHSKLFEYKQAFDDITELLAKYSSLMPQTDIDDYKNTNIIWAALSNAPKQKVIVTENTALKILHDKAGLQNLEASLDTVTIPFIFDTGANLSTVTESTAKRFRMKVLDSVIDVNSITGLKVKSKIGICPEFNLGHIRILNAIFLVFPDSALAIPQINFQIHGIIGFPVIEAMKEIQITRNGEFIVPVNRSSYEFRNMAIDFLNPIIDLDGESYTFDSGANSTLLYDRYYQKNHSRIDSLYKETSISIGGAGGSITKRGYVVQFKTRVGNQPVTLDSVQLFKENIKEDNSFYGNIGQDLIRKFKKMTLNFQDMFIRFD